MSVPTITLAAPPDTATIATQILSTLAAESGVATDYNIGSQVRTLSEAIGSAVDEQAAIVQALAFQAIVYAAFAAYSITPFQAVYATGFVVFTVATGAPSTQTIAIPAGTIVESSGGVQYATTSAGAINAGGTTVTIAAQAVNPGSAGNTANAGAITALVSGIAYPLTVAGVGTITDGADAEQPSQTLARFTAAVAAVGGGSPVGIANGVIGVSVPGTAETVRYATCYEPWTTQSVGSQTAGFDVYVDNGSGGASSALLLAVNAALLGSAATNTNGLAPAGVPYSVYAVTPVSSAIVVNAVLVNTSLAAQLTASVQIAVTNYFNSLQFGAPAQITQVIAAVANVLAGNITSLSVTMLDSTGTSQTVISPAVTARMLLSSVTANLT